MAESNDPAKQGNEDAAFRGTLRRDRIRAREALPASVHKRASVRIAHHLYTLLSLRPPALLGFYWPIRAEVDCRPLVARMIGAGWTACLPHIAERNRAMTFRAWTPESRMVDGEHGIPTVAEGALVVPDVVLLPVNAFDRKGYRLGYGGGYYDRTLASLPDRPYVLGIGFDLARVESISPHAQDCVMDAVVTESGVEVFP